MLLPQLLFFLDRHQIKYQSCQLGPGYGPADVAGLISGYGMGWVDTQLLELDGKDLAVAVIPASLTLDQLVLAQRFAPRKVRVLSPREAEQRISGGSNLPPFGHLFGAKVFASTKIEQFQSIAFFVDSNSHYLTLNARDFHRLLAANSALEIPTRTRYRAYASPARKSLYNCILGVSLENPDFYTPKLQTILRWIRSHYRNCMVMIGDSVHRITLEIDKGLPEAVALVRAHWLARDFVQAQWALFEAEGPDDTAFQFVFCSDVQKSPEYSRHYKTITSLHRNNQRFKQGFDEFADIFVGRRQYPPEEKARYVDLSSQYLLEELAIVACLAQEEPCTFVYPGSLTILNEIASGEHPGVPASLLKMDYV